MSGITSESHIWTPEKGLQSGGYISEGVISPPRQVKTAQDHVYDVVVIGAGYAGLIAARDLVNAGKLNIFHDSSRLKLFLGIPLTINIRRPLSSRRGGPGPCWWPNLHYQARGLQL